MNAGCRIGAVRYKAGVSPLAAAAATAALMHGTRRMRADFAGASIAENALLTTPFAYDADSFNSQEFGAWQPWLRSPDGESNWYRDRRVGRTRDLYRNDGWAVGGITSILDNTIGSTFRLICRPDYLALSRVNKAMDAKWADEFARVVESEWRLWADDPGHWCDAARKLSLVQLWRLDLEHKLVDGEDLNVLLWDPDAIGPGAARYATRVHGIDPDRLSNPYEGPDTHNLRAGVEIDERGAPVAYHIRRAHQNDIFDSAASMIWDRVPHETEWGRPIVVHDYEQHRFATHRGVGLLTPVLATMKMLSNYDRAEMQQALLQTAIGTFVESPYDPEQLRMAMEAPADGDPGLNAYQQMRSEFHGARGTNYAGVRIPTLVPGEKIQFAPPRHPSQNFEMFEYAMLRRAAAAAGTTAEEFTRDFSKANYSSLRAAMLGAWKTMARRRHDFSTGTCSPVYAAMLEEIIDRYGREILPRNAPDFLEMRAAYLRGAWIGPGRGWIDPVKERQGAVLGLDAGFGTLRDEAADIAGADWREQLEQRALEVKEFKRLDLPLPSWSGGAPEGDEPANETARKPLPV